MSEPDEGAGRVHRYSLCAYCLLLGQTEVINVVAESHMIKAFSVRRACVR